MNLSVITINKNNADGLRKTILSVIQQKYTDFEYIVIDGKSSDESVAVAVELLNNCSIPTSLISENDSGIYNAMNKGIDMSHGDYLLFLNSGDTFVDNHCLQKVFEKNHTSDIINARCNVTDGDSIIWTSPYLPKITLKTLYTVGIPHQSTFIKRDLFMQYGYYREDFKYNSDIAFWYRTILFGNASTSALDLIVTNYDNKGVSSTNSKTESYIREMNEILSEGVLPRVIPDYEEEKEYRKTMKEFEWLVTSPALRSILRLIHRIQIHIK